MKKLFFLLFLFTVSVAFSQVHFSISGTVTNRNTHKGIYHAIVRMVGSDGTVIALMTDSSGHCYFDSTYVKHNTSYILYADGSGQEYLMSHVKDTVTTIGLISSKVFSFHIELERSDEWSTIKFPHVLFEFGKSELTQGVKDTILNYYVKLFNDNPTMVIELDAHTSSDEGDNKQKMTLSLARAQICRAYLISQGVDSLRLKPKSWGDKKPICEAKAITQMKTKEEKEKARAINRRCEFRVLSFDYIPKK